MSIFTCSNNIKQWKSEKF